MTAHAMARATAICDVRVAAAGANATKIPNTSMKIVAPWTSECCGAIDHVADTQASTANASQSQVYQPTRTQPVSQSTKPTAAAESSSTQRNHEAGPRNSP